MDYITLVTSHDPANKSYIRKDTGIEKHPPKYHSIRTAVTRHIPDLNALKQTLEQIGDMDNCILILGYIKGTEEGTPYNLISSAELKKLTGLDEVPGLHDIGGLRYAARLKTTFVQSSYFIFDRDEVDGMPESLKYDSHVEWWDFMRKWLPMLDGAGYLLAPSNSGRVRVDGEVFASDNHHVYVKAVDGNDIERFGRAALIHAFSHGAGYMKQNNGGGHRPWTVFDPTTFSREREIYDGKPVVEGLGMTVDDMRVIAVEGGVIDTSRLLNPTHEQQHGLGMNLVRTKSDSWQVHDTTSLTLDTVIDFKDSGEMSLRQWDDLGLERERCQSPFRPDSQSMAAYVNRTKEGDLFLHDVGTATNFYLMKQAKDLFKEVKVESLVTKQMTVVTSGVLDSNELELLEKKLKQEILGTAKKREYAECLCKAADVLRQDLKQYWFDVVRHQMNWNKSEFSKIIKSYREDWYKNNGGDSGWLIDNIAIITEKNGGFYNFNRNVFQSQQSLNALYADMNLGDESASGIISSSDNKMIADRIGWSPLDEKIFSWDGNHYINTYKPPQFEQIQGDVSQWLELCNYIYGDYTRYVLQHMAFTLQHPNEKIRWQVMAWGKARTGKTLSVEPLVRILGNSAGVVSPDEMIDSWGDLYYQKKVLVFEEVMMNDKREFNRLKAKLTNDGIEKLNIKGQGQATQRNIYAMYMFSNHSDALRFEQDQRKLLVVQAPDEQLSSEFYESLGRLIKTDEYISHIYYYLMNMDLSDFEHTRLPVQTDSELEMIENSKPDYEIQIKEMMEYKEGVFSLPAFSYVQLKDMLKNHDIKCSAKNIKRVLNENGCFSHERQKKQEGKIVKGRFWAVKKEDSIGNNHVFWQALPVEYRI